MTMRRWVLVGSVPAVLLVLVALVITWRTSPSAQVSTTSRPPSPMPSTPPRIGADGIGDPYFPRAGDGGYDVTGYDIQVR
ncbi:MAG: hypothetical protein JO063_03415, partial [Pseudonocardiales bacterium]|nr:hypothetical protein [Pseudonocardiales bacterium]